MVKGSRYFLLVISILLLNTQVFAQNLGGLNQSIYSGVLGIESQPAYLGNFAYKWDVNIIGASAGLLVKDLIPESSISNTFYQGDRGSLSTVITNKSQNFFVNGRIFLPSVAYRIDDKSGIAFNWNIRAVGFGRASSRSLSLVAEYNGLEKMATLPKLESALGIVNSWQDFSLSYGRNVIRNTRHMLNVGASVKYLIGGASGFVDFSNIDVSYDEATNTISDLEGQVTLVFNDNIENVSNGESEQLFTSSGIGFDFGLIYEFKGQKQLNHQIDRAGEPNYLLRLSTSVVDVGSISFKASNKSAFYNLSLQQPISPGYFNNISSIGDLATRLDNAFALDKREFQDYNLRLPTALITSLDWNVYNHFYVLGQVKLTAANIKESVFNSGVIDAYQFCLRYERPKYGFYSTISFDVINNGGVSFAARYSILYLGVSNLFRFNADESVRALGLIAMIRVPILNPSRKGKGNVF